jgi:eukaryotic-like serine/threonine-protein kinase
MTLQVGDVLAGRFEIRSQIGAGAFGAVYLAHDRDLARLVAIKELSSNNPELDTKEYRVQKEKFDREARAVSQFQHPNVVSVYQSLHEAGADYLVLEYVAGGTLRKQLDSVKQLSVERSIAIALDICRAIGAMTQYGVVHRDIKPGNILLTPDGSAKLTDFGVAQLSHGSERSKATGTRHPGTPKYMSPEQETSVGYLDARSDLYSLGLVLYEMLTGQAYKAARKPVRQVNPDVPRWLEMVLDKALQPNRDQRFQNAQEMEKALLRVQKPAGAASAARAPLPSKAVWAVIGLIGAAAAIILGLALIPPILSGSGSTPTAMPTAVPVLLKTATAAATSTPTPTLTATVTPTPLPTDTPAPTETTGPTKTAAASKPTNTIAAPTVTSPAAASKPTNTIAAPTVTSPAAASKPTNTIAAPTATSPAAASEPLGYGFEFKFCTYDGDNYTCNMEVWGSGGSGSYFFAMENPDTGNWDQQGPVSRASYLMRSRRCRTKIQQLRYWDSAGNHPDANPNITMDPDAIAELFPGGACTP